MAAPRCFSREPPVASVLRSILLDDLAGLQTTLPRQSPRLRSRRRSYEHRYHETTCGGRIPGLPSTPELTRAAERDRRQACSAAALLLVQELSSRPTARLADRRGFDDRESLRSCCQSVVPVR